MAAYAVSKAALVHLTRVLDLELRPLGIRVNAVAPQLLDTAKNRPCLTPDLLAHAVTPEAVADTIAYLVSDAAAPVAVRLAFERPQLSGTADTIGLAARLVQSCCEYPAPGAPPDASGHEHSRSRRRRAPADGGEPGARARPRRLAGA